MSRPYCGYFDTIYDKVSALIHGIVFNHGFVDGNKRTSLYLAILLIEKSGYSIRVNPDAMIEVIPAVARGEMTREELAEWLQNEIIVESNHN
ncbi:MAG: type II toxin-antitoxin system death-on-curing family toxin [Bacteroidetes bacterium]|nr:type II toxin-antitoxin system death-on-curing family toxin [Bacteroidota bacterium]